MTDCKSPTLTNSHLNLSSAPLETRTKYSSATILLVDDDNACRDVVRQILEFKGFSVLTAASPDQAMEIAEKTPEIDLLISDVIMPGQNGFDLYKKMQLQRPQLPVLFISGYPIVPPGMEKENAVVNLLLKPFSVAKLMDMVQATLLR